MKKSFTSKNSLFQHCGLKHEEIISDLKCDLCNKWYNSESAFKDHFGMIHNITDNFLCHICGRIFLKAEKLNYHIESIHEQSKISDHNSGKIIGETKNKLKRVGHLKRHKSILGKGEKQIEEKQCSICHKTFDTAETLKVHLSVCNGGDLKGSRPAPALKLWRQLRGHSQISLCTFHYFLTTHLPMVMFWQ